jgi:hypothetical protein
MRNGALPGIAMSTLILQRASAIYAAADLVRETIHHVNDPIAEHLYKVSRTLQKQWRQLGPEDTNLLDALQKLTWFTNLAVTTPLPLAYPGLHKFCSPDELLLLLNRATLSYPECAANVQDTIRAFERAIPLAITELGVKVCDLVQQHDRVALITGRQWLNAAVLEHINSITGRSDIVPIRTADLRKDEVYDVVIVISPPSWIEPQVRNAIRAKQRDIVTLSLFQRDTAQISVLPEYWKPITTFRQFQRAATATQSPHDEIGADLTAQDTAEGFEISTVLGRIQAQSTSTAAAGGYTSLGDAEALHVANGSVVLLPAEGKTWTVEQEGDTFRVEQHEAADIQAGDFVMLRTQRDHELIVEIADKQLGSAGVKLRELQVIWKQNLRRHIDNRGLSTVARDMATNGLGSLASPANVRRWADEEFIRNHKYDHWNQLMKYLGLGELSDQLWAAMGDINDAHRRAGFTISKVIKAKLETLSIKEIRDSMELPSMPELGDERLTLYLVQERLGIIHDIRFTDMNRVVKW